jgi:dTDP-4-dehydrorhamnose 3,5-epimerase
MIFHQLPLAGAYRIEMERRKDSRGFFARSYCFDEFSAKGLKNSWVQSNMSFNVHKGTVRGMHYQLSPHAEAKLVRCVRGAIFDVMVDIRAGSVTYGQWAGARLDEDNREMLYIPEGFGHGYQALTDEAEVIYMVSARYAPAAERGINAFDPSLGIAWPGHVTEVSEKDKHHPLLRDIEPVQLNISKT